MPKKTTKELSLPKEDRQASGGGGKKTTKVLQPKKYKDEVPAWSGLGGGMNANLPAANQNAQQWSDQWDENAVTSYRADEKFVPQKPAWMNSGLRGGVTENVQTPLPAWLGGQRPPAYGGGYNPTIRPKTEGGGGGEEQWKNPYSAAPVNNSTSDTLRGMRPEVGMPDYTGVPVNNSYSDTLRGITPIQRGDSMTFSDLLRSLAAGQQYSQVPFNAPAAWSGNGFGSNYGGNWRKGGGGGGGGWGGGGYGDWGNDQQYPAWMQNMGLYSWKFG